MPRESNWNKEAKILIKTGEVRSGMNGTELAAMAKICASTYYKRRRNPAELTLEELAALAVPMRLKDEEILFLAAKR